MEVKSLQNPPAGVKLVMETACIMFGERPKMKDDPGGMGGGCGVGVGGGVVRGGGRSRCGGEQGRLVTRALAA